jgi:hypothetical protein
MHTELYESDPFTAKRQDLLAAFESDYRFEKGDEVYIDRARRPLKVRIIDVRVHLSDGGRLTREMLALKL